MMFHESGGGSMAARKSGTGAVANPFRIHGVVEGDAFADREREVARIARALTEAGSKLMMYGPRRMGKTSALLRAVERVRAGKGHALFADLSTASTATDMSNRILAAAGAALGRSFREFVSDLVSHLRLTVTLTPDPATGLMLPGLDLAARDWDAERQRQTLGDVLDALDATAKQRGITIGVALDEFQEITRLGGESAEWQLRGAIQHHQHLAYVLAGSREHIISRMTGSSGAFYKLADKLPFGPIDPTLLSSWIDGRFDAAGLRSNRAGAAIVAASGPRTRDIMQLARMCFDRAQAAGAISAGEVESALREIVAEENDLHHAVWRGLTPLQQNVLRAVAAGDGGLSSKAVLRSFSLSSSGAAINAAASLLDDGLLTRTDAYSGARVNTPTGYAFDSPYFLAWVWWNTLQDLGPAYAALAQGMPGTVNDGSET